MKRRMLLSLFVCLLCFVNNVVTGQETVNGSIKGRIVAKDDKSMSGGTVNFFNATGPSPFSHEYFRYPDYSDTLPDDGSFSIELPEGTYYLIAVKKSIGKKPGPPEEGDLIYPSGDDRAPKPYIVKAGETTDTGTLAEVVPFKKEWAAEGATSIEGVVLDWKGKPYEGVLVLASEDAAMEGPLFVSDSRTGTDGRYILRVPEGGQYYVRVKGQKEIITSCKG